MNNFLLGSLESTEDSRRADTPRVCQPLNIHNDIVDYSNNPIFAPCNSSSMPSSPAFHTSLKQLYRTSNHDFPSSTHEIPISSDEQTARYCHGAHKSYYKNSCTLSPALQNNYRYQLTALGRVSPEPLFYSSATTLSTLPSHKENVGRINSFPITTTAATMIPTKCESLSMIPRGIDTSAYLHYASPTKVFIPFAQRNNFYYPLTTSNIANIIPNAPQSSICSEFFHRSNRVRKAAQSIESISEQNEALVRKTKLKTELCLYYKKRVACPFGDSCTYAHGEEELQLTKLMDLNKTGLIDIITYRTKPCFTWIATGSCPFGKRCTNIHDPRCAAASDAYNSWLPHTETQGNAMDTDINVEISYHKRTNEILYDNPFGEQFSIFVDSFYNLYNSICNISFNNRPNSQNTIQKQKHKIYHQNTCGSTPITQLQKIHIALQMRNNNDYNGDVNGSQWQYKYRPQYIIFNEYCMVLQIRAFHLTKTGLAVELPFGNKSYSSSGTNKNMKKKDVVIVHEIAFGPDSDPNVRDIALWFDVSEDDVVAVTSAEAKRYRLKRGPQLNRISKDSTGILSQSYEVKNKESESNSDNKENESNTRNRSKFRIETHSRSKFDDLDSFRIIRPDDSDAYNLTTKVLWHQYKLLKAHKIVSMKARYEMQEKLAKEKEDLKSLFENQRRYWIKWGYPINSGRARTKIDECTLVPLVNGFYNISSLEQHNSSPKPCYLNQKHPTCEGRDKTSVNKLSEAYTPLSSENNKDGQNVGGNNSHETIAAFSKDPILGSAAQHIWKSFVSQKWNSQKDALSFVMDQKDDDLFDSMDSNTKKKWKQLSIFQRLSRGDRVCNDRTLPHILDCQLYIDDQNKTTNTSLNHQSEKCWKSILLRPTKTHKYNEWKIVREHFERSKSKKTLSIIQQ